MENLENKYYKWSKNGNKMLLNTDFKEFNKQTNCISTGNVVSNTQYSSYIRPCTETFCNGNTFENGQLQTYDLKFFNIPNYLKEYIKRINEKIVLYEFFIYNKDKQKDIIGWIIESKNGFSIQRNFQGLKNNQKRYSTLEYLKGLLENEKFKSF